MRTCSCGSVRPSSAAATAPRTVSTVDKAVPPDQVVPAVTDVVLRGRRTASSRPVRRLDRLLAATEQVGGVEQLGLVLELLRRPVVADPAALEDVGGLRERRARRARTARSGGRRRRVAATASSTGTRRLTTTGARPSESSSTSITFGLRDERLGEHDHLLLAAGERARHATVQRFSSSGKSSSACAIPLFAPRSVERVGRDAQVVLDGEARAAAGGPPGTTATPARADLLGPAAGQVDVAEQ